MDDRNALSMVTARMLIDSTGDVEDATDQLHEYLQPLVGKTRAKRIVEDVAKLVGIEENEKRVKQAIARRKNAPQSEDVDALKKRIAELEASQKRNDATMDLFRTEREIEQHQELLDIANAANDTDASKKEAAALAALTKRANKLKRELAALRTEAEDE